MIIKKKAAKNDANATETVIKPPGPPSNDGNDGPNAEVCGALTDWKKKHPSVKMGGATFCDNYLPMSGFDWWKAGVVRTGQVLCCADSAWKNLGGAFSVKKFLLLGVLVARSLDVITSAGGSGKTSRVRQTRNSLFSIAAGDTLDQDGMYEWKMPERGEIVSMKRLCDSAKLEASDRSCPPCATPEHDCNMVLITQGYKNDKDAVSSVVGGIIAHRREIAGDETQKTHDAALDRWKPVAVSGSGGSPSAAGAHCPNVGRDARDKPYASFPLAQSIESKCNITMMNMVERNAAVAIYVGIEKFFGETEAKRILNELGHDVGGNEQISLDDAALFLGYYQAGSAAYEQRWFNGDHDKEGAPIDFVDKPEIVSPDTDCSYITGVSQKDIDQLKTSGQYSLFLQVAHFTFRFLPLFSDREQRMLRQRKRFRRLVCPENSREIVSINVHTNFPLQRLLDPSNDFPINRRAIISFYIHSGQWKIFSKRSYLETLGRKLVGEDAKTSNQDAIYLAEGDGYSDDAEDDLALSSAAGSSVSLNGIDQVRIGNAGERDKFTPLTEREVVKSCVFLSAAVSFRFLGNGLERKTHGGKLSVRPLPTSCMLPSPHQIHATPCPNRTIDPVPLTIISLAITDGLLTKRSDSGDFRDRRKRIDDFPMGQSKRQTIGRYLFMAALLRVTGRINGLAVYRRAAGKKEWMVTPESLEPYLDWLVHVCSGEKNQSTLHLRSTQHSGQIFTSVGTSGGLVSFLRKLAQEIYPCVDKMLSLGGDRRKAMILFALCLVDCAQGADTDKEKTGGLWIANESIADIEEVFLDPFGTPTVQSVVPGFGCREGLKCIVDPEAGTRIGKNKSASLGEESDVTINLSYSGTTRGFEMERLLSNLGTDKFARIVPVILKEMGHLSDEELVVLHMFRRPDGRICATFNGREIGMKDGEHVSCKTYIERCILLSGRSISQQPKLYSKYCHPVPTFDGEVPWSENKEWLEKEMKNSSETFIRLREGGKLSLSLKLVFLGETDDSGRRFPPTDEQVATRLKQMRELATQCATTRSHPSKKPKGDQKEKRVADPDKRTCRYENDNDYPSRSKRVKLPTRRTRPGNIVEV